MEDSDDNEEKARDHQAVGLEMCWLLGSPQTPPSLFPKEEKVKQPEVVAQGP